MSNRCIRTSYDIGDGNSVSSISLETNKGIQTDPSTCSLMRKRFTRVKSWLGQCYGASQEACAEFRNHLRTRSEESFERKIQPQMRESIQDTYVPIPSPDQKYYINVKVQTRIRGNVKSRLRRGGKWKGPFSYNVPVSDSQRGVKTQTIITGSIKRNRELIKRTLQTAGNKIAQSVRTTKKALRKCTDGESSSEDEEEETCVRRQLNSIFRTRSDPDIVRQRENQNNHAISHVRDVGSGIGKSNAFDGINEGMPKGSSVKTLYSITQCEKKNDYARQSAGRESPNYAEKTAPSQKRPLYLSEPTGNNEAHSSYYRKEMLRRCKDLMHDENLVFRNERDCKQFIRKALNKLRPSQELHPGRKHNLVTQSYCNASVPIVERHEQKPQVSAKQKDNSEQSNDGRYDEFCSMDDYVETLTELFIAGLKRNVTLAKKSKLS